MDTILPVADFSLFGRYLMILLFLLACGSGISGLVNLVSARPVWERHSFRLLGAVNLVFVAGFLWICWFHYRIYALLPLELPRDAALWLNRQLEAMNSHAAYAMPLYDPSRPPRYAIPVWIEYEKYYFWFMSYGLMALAIRRRLRNHRLGGTLDLLLAVQVGILFLAADPFAHPLPRFFDEVGPWFAAGGNTGTRLALFMRLYPRMLFYYNAQYMWFHPPLLFMAYASITVTFAASLFMLSRREPAIEKVGYDCARLGYFMLTLGMLLGYPWALQAWGPNWWWDPKIASSIMLWVVFSAYLHTRLHANKPVMWYFSSVLGIVSFVAMLFTFLASFYFPGQHTFQ